MSEKPCKYTTSFIYIEESDRFIAIECIKIFHRNGSYTDIFFWEGGWSSIFDPVKKMWFELVEAQKKLNNRN